MVWHKVVLRRLETSGLFSEVGWDDYPHEGVVEIEQLKSYPHHFQRRTENGSWTFEASSMRGDIEHEIDIVIAVVRAYLRQ